MDVVVTVAKAVWLGWLAEGMLPGEDGAEEWALYYGSGRGARNPAPPKELDPGDRVYVAAFGFVRGYSPLRRIQVTKTGYALVRAGAAVAVTPFTEGQPPHRSPGFSPHPVAGFQGVRYRTWSRDVERPFADWMTYGLPPNVRATVERLQRLRTDPDLREELSRRALAGMASPQIFNGLPRELPRG